MDCTEISAMYNRESRRDEGEKAGCRAMDVPPYAHDSVCVCEREYSSVNFFSSLIKILYGSSCREEYSDQKYNFLSNFKKFNKYKNNLKKKKIYQIGHVVYIFVYLSTIFTQKNFQKTIQNLRPAWAKGRK